MVVNFLKMTVSLCAKFIQFINNANNIFSATQARRFAETIENAIWTNQVW